MRFKETLNNSNTHRTTSNNIEQHRTNRTNQDIFRVKFDYCSIRLGNRTPIVRLSLIEFDDLIKKIGLIGFRCAWKKVLAGCFQTGRRQEQAKVSSPVQ